MEGGNITKINLESPIDVKSSDMLVPVTSPKFLHNRQKFQGHVLPSSLRFEADGWAAGTDVYDIDVGSPVYEVDGYKVKRYRLKDNSTYMLKIYDTNNNLLGNILFNADKYLKSVHNISNPEINDTSIAGTFAGHDFLITIDDYVEDGKQHLTFTSEGNTLSLSTETEADGMTLFTVYDDTTEKAVAFTYNKAGNVLSSSDVADDYNMMTYYSTAEDSGVLVHLFKRADISVTIVDNVNGASVAVNGLENVSNVTVESFEDDTVVFTFEQVVDIDMNFSFTGDTQAYELAQVVVDDSGQMITQDADGNSLSSKYSEISVEVTGANVSLTKGIDLKVRVPFWSNFYVEAAPLNDDSLFGNTLTVKGCSAHIRKLFDEDLSATLYDKPDRIENGSSISRSQIGTVKYNVYMLDYDPRFATQEYTSGMTADMSYVGLLGPANNGTSAVDCFKNAKEFVTDYAANIAAGSEFRANSSVAAEDNHLDLYLIRQLSNWILSNNYMPDGIDIEEVVEQYMGYIETLQADAELTTTIDDLINDNDISIAVGTTNDAVQGTKSNKYKVNIDSEGTKRYGTATWNKLGGVFSSYTYNTEGTGAGTGSGSGTNYTYNKAQCFTCIPYRGYNSAAQRWIMTAQTGAFTIDTDNIYNEIYKKVLCTGKLSLANRDITYTPFNVNLGFYRGNDKYGDNQFNFSQSHLLVVITDVDFDVATDTAILDPNGSVPTTSGTVKWTSHSENAWTLLPVFTTLAYNGYEYYNTNYDPDAK